AERDLQCLTERGDRMLVFHRVDPLVAFLMGSEIMPKVFFKMSRCWRSSAFSLRSAAFSACRSPGDPAGIELFFHPYNCPSRMPNCVAISCAGLPLFCHNATASRLKLGSNFLRFFIVGTAACFIVELSFFYVKQYPSNRSNLSTRQIEATSTPARASI